MTDADVLIVGGGIHGTHLALRLVLEDGWSPDRLTILDPHSRLLEQWRRRTQAVGMAHLRSPDVHHLGITPFELREEVSRKNKRRAFLSPYSRPRLSLFDEHSDALIDRTRLMDRHVRARALEARREGNGVCVETTAGTARARRLVLAPGRDPRPLPSGFVSNTHRPSSRSATTASALRAGLKPMSWVAG